MTLTSTIIRILESFQDFRAHLTLRRAVLSDVDKEHVTRIRPLMSMLRGWDGFCSVTALTISDKPMEEGLIYILLESRHLAPRLRVSDKPESGALVEHCICSLHADNRPCGNLFLSRKIITDQKVE